MIDPMTQEVADAMIEFSKIAIADACEKLPEFKDVHDILEQKGLSTTLENIFRVGMHYGIQFYLALDDVQDRITG